MWNSEEFKETKVQTNIKNFSDYALCTSNTWIQCKDDMRKGMNTKKATVC